MGPLASSSAIKWALTIRTLPRVCWRAELAEEEKLVERSAERGKELLDGLRARLKGHPLVREVRGRGLLVGVELGPTGTGLIQKAAPVIQGHLDLAESIQKNLK